MVERATVNRLVVGSSPTVPARAISSAVEHLPYKEIVTGSIPVLPMYDIFDVGLDWIPNKDQLVEDLIKKHLNSRLHYRINKANAFVCSELTGNISKHLAEVLVDKYPNIQLTGKWSEFAYISNKNWTKAYYHNHIPRDGCGDYWYKQHLSTVFYIRNPGGSLCIVDENKNKNVIMPKDGQFVVFPLHTIHSPLPYVGDEYRIVLNINYNTNNTHSDFLNISNQTG